MRNVGRVLAFPCVVFNTQWQCAVSSAWPVRSAISARSNQCAVYNAKKFPLKPWGCFGVGAKW